MSELVTVSVYVESFSNPLPLPNLVHLSLLHFLASPYQIGQFLSVTSLPRLQALALQSSGWKFALHSFRTLLNQLDMLSLASHDYRDGIFPGDNALVLYDLHIGAGADVILGLRHARLYLPEGMPTEHVDTILGSPPLDNPTAKALQGLSSITLPAKWEARGTPALGRVFDECIKAGVVIVFEDPPDYAEGTLLSPKFWAARRKIVDSR